VEALQAQLIAASRRREAVIIGSVLLVAGLVWIALERAPGWPGWGLAATGAGWLLATRRSLST
jgi:hypothetical protein